MIGAMRLPFATSRGIAPRVWLVLLLAFALTPLAHAAPRGKVVRGTLETGGATRSYLLYVPAQPRPGKARAARDHLPRLRRVARACHGHQRVERPRGEARAFSSRTPREADCRCAGGRTAAPEAPTIRRRMCCSSRTCSTCSGASTGSTLRASTPTACRTARAWRPCSGAGSAGASQPSAASAARTRCHRTNRNPRRPVPMIVFHGTADPIVPYGGGTPTRFAPPMPSVAEWVREQARLNGCKATPEELPARGVVTGVRYPDPARRADVVLYTIDGGGHTWPGGGDMPKAIVGDQHPRHQRDPSHVGFLPEAPDGATQTIARRASAAAAARTAATLAGCCPPTHRRAPRRCPRFPRPPSPPPAHLRVPTSPPSPPPPARLAGLPSLAPTFRWGARPPAITQPASTGFQNLQSGGSPPTLRSSPPCASRAWCLTNTPETACAPPPYCNPCATGEQSAKQTPPQAPATDRHRSPPRLLCLRGFVREKPSRAGANAPPSHPPCSRSAATPPPRAALNAPHPLRVLRVLAKY